MTYRHINSILIEYAFYVTDKKMNNSDLEMRLVSIEMNLTNQEKMLDELSDIIAEQAKTLDMLKKQHEQLLQLWQENVLRPQSEETPPPHY